MTQNWVFERTRMLKGELVADFITFGQRPHQISFNVGTEIHDALKELVPGLEYSLTIEIDDVGPCAMRLLAINGLVSDKNYFDKA